MLWLFWVVAALLALFISQNVRYAIYQYWANRQRAVFTLYIIFLIIFVYIVMHLTFHVLDFTQQAQQMDIVNVPG